MQTGDGCYVKFKHEHTMTVHGIPDEKIQYFLFRLYGFSSDFILYIQENHDSNFM